MIKASAKPPTRAGGAIDIWLESPRGSTRPDTSPAGSHGDDKLPACTIPRQVATGTCSGIMKVLTKLCRELSDGQKKTRRCSRWVLLREAASGGRPFRLFASGLPFFRRLGIPGHRSLHERLECARVDLFPFVDVDRPSRIAFQTGTPLHFHSSTTSGSACLMSLRILSRVFPRQSSSSAILFEISSGADWPWLASDFFMFSPWKVRKISRRPAERN